MLLFTQACNTCQLEPCKSKSHSSLNNSAKEHTHTRTHTSNVLLMLEGGLAHKCTTKLEQLESN